MPTINRDLLLSEVKFYLGDIDEYTKGPNVLPDVILLSTAEGIISKVGDDEDKYAEVKCKLLKSAAEQNQTMASIDPGRGMKRDESNFREVEWFSNNPVDFWQDFIDKLPQLCKSFGYCELPSNNKGMFYISVSHPIRYPHGSAPIGSNERKAYPNGRPKRRYD